MDKLIESAISFGGTLASAALIAVVGLVVAKFLRKVVVKAAEKVVGDGKAIKKLGVGFDVVKAVGGVVYYSVLYVAVTSALKRLGVDLVLLDTLMSAVLAALPLGLAIDYGVNGLAHTKKLFKGKLL